MYLSMYLIILVEQALNKYEKEGVEIYSAGFATSAHVFRSDIDSTI